MTTSPRLPASLGRPAPGLGDDPGATGAELDRMMELALGRRSRTVALGSGRSAAAGRALAAFARRWEAASGIVLDTVSWPEEAASWLRQAARFTAAEPDLWVMAGPARGWAQVTRRLLWSTPWRPERTIAFAAVGEPPAIELVGACNLPGLTGATADGGTWTVRDGRLRTAGPAGADR
jgi:hypothetical protein